MSLLFASQLKLAPSVIPVMMVILYYDSFTQYFNIYKRFLLFFPFKMFIISFDSPSNSLNVGREVKVKSLSRVRLFVTQWSVAYQAPQSMGFSRQEYWSGLPFPSPGDLPHPGIKPGSPASQADALPSEPPGNP